MKEDRVYFSRVKDPEGWEPAEYVDRLTWRGWYVYVDGDTVRFGNSEHDWIKPVGPDGGPRPLGKPRLANKGRWLVIPGSNHRYGSRYEFVFYNVKEFADARLGVMFAYFWRDKSRVRRVLKALLGP